MKDKSIEQAAKEKFIDFLTNNGRHRYIDISVANEIIKYVETKILPLAAQHQNNAGVWKELRNKFFEEHTVEKHLGNNENFIRRVSTAPHDLFEWFKSQLYESPTPLTDGWISVEDDLPKCIEGKDFSENVFALIDNKIHVMAYCYIDNDEDSGWAWCTCNGNINGDPEFDDDYNVTHWRKLPEPKHPLLTTK